MTSQTEQALVSHNNNSKWWWKRSSKKQAPISSTIDNTHQQLQTKAASVNGADENASLYSLYSYNDDSIFCPPSPSRLSSSIMAHHAKSEYSDVDSMASITSRPWVSRNSPVVSFERAHYQEEDEEVEEEEEEEDEEEEEEEECDDVVDDNLLVVSDYITTAKSASQENMNSTEPQQKRRASLVDIMNSRFKTGLGRLVGNGNHKNNLTAATSKHETNSVIHSPRRRKSVS